VDIEQPPTHFHRALSVSAHPDDSEFFAGGTLARLAESGVDITLVVCTDGSKGGRDIENIIETRSTEQDKAARVLGINEVIKYGFGDGDLVPGTELRNRLIETIRLVRPDVIFAHHPKTFYKQYGSNTQLGHSDHRAVGTALLEAVYPRAGSPNFFPGLGGEPWSPREIWLYDCEDPDYLIDIGRSLDQKVEALNAHQSQHGTGGGLPEAARRVGRYLGTEEQPAEAFVRLILRRQK